ncbi:P-loop containing nucleoside triphosphate hydrolase protein [Lactarius hengduanensis]|nr:P-loop containing nucleoside triphosphate hydrolase protein [Lactarius hengduanensis]
MTLKHVFRQRDQAFVDILNAMRWGQMSKDSISKLHQLSREIVYEDDIEPTELYPTKNEVEDANDTRLAQIAENPVEFNAVDRPGFDERGNPVPLRKMARLLSRLVALPVVSLKTGAQVMLIKNLEQGHLVNGTTEYFSAGRNKPEDEGHRAVQQCSTRWPLVKFTNGSQRLCVLEGFTVNGSRTQVPLILAWALSVHKSQGQTLERVRVDLRNTFEKGQAYVRNFDPPKVMAHPRDKEPHERPTDSDEYDQYLTD